MARKQRRKKNGRRKIRRLREVRENVSIETEMTGSNTLCVKTTNKTGNSFSSRYITVQRS